MKIRILLLVLTCSLVFSTVSCANSGDVSISDSTTQPSNTVLTETTSETSLALLPSTKESTTEPTTEELTTEEPTPVESTTASTTEETTTEEPTTVESTTVESTTIEPSITEPETTENVQPELADDFVRQLVIRTSEFPTATAGSSLKMANLSADWVNQVSISGFTDQDLQNTVRMAYDELSPDAQTHFDHSFQNGVAEVSMRLLQGDEAARKTLQDAGGQLTPVHMSAEHWQDYIAIVLHLIDE